MGVETSDDAAVYRISDEIALIQTLDFFTPIVNDPYTFGQIAAANSLSDVYAMGGEPILALNIVCFPDCLDPSILSDILRGGQDKVNESGAVLAGGHSVSDDEPKYGLSVAGIVHPDQIMTNNGAKPGDILVLTKPIGVGVINTAIKGEIASKTATDAAILSMVTLNSFGARAMKGLKNVHSVTDITGFGLLGHAVEMAEGSGVTIRLKSQDLPIIPEASDYAAMGLVPAGAYKNRNFFENRIQMGATIDPIMQDLLYDPQTSGGLLISLSPEEVPSLLDNLKDSPVAYGVVGCVEALGDRFVIVE